jgi:hypothetical protein
VQPVCCLPPRPHILPTDICRHNYQMDGTSRPSN